MGLKIQDSFVMKICHGTEKKTECGTIAMCLLQSSLDCYTQQKSRVDAAN